MLRNPISFIFKLGKDRSLPFQPLRTLSADSENPSLARPRSLNNAKAPVTVGQARHSNQMSS